MRVTAENQLDRFITKFEKRFDGLRVTGVKILRTGLGVCSLIQVEWSRSNAPVPTLNRGWGREGQSR